MLHFLAKADSSGVLDGRLGRNKRIPEIMGSAGLLSSVCAGCATESQKNSERAWMDLNGSVAFLQTFWCKNGRLPTNDQYNSHIRKDPNVLEGVQSDWRFSCWQGTGKDKDAFLL
jgi:hypothetical protein